MASVRAKFIKKIISEKINFNKLLKDNPELDFSKIAGAEVIGPRKIKVPSGYTERVEKLADEVFLEIIEPKENKNDKVIYYLHGGGYVMGLGDMYRRLDKKLSRAGGGATGVWMSTNTDYYGNSSWWLRSPYCSGNSTARFVGFRGSVHNYTYTSSADFGVVPALVINMA